MADFTKALEFILANEKGLSENPHDLGGITNFGISLRFLKCIPLERLSKYGVFEEPNEDTIRNLKEEQAHNIYHGEFWENCPFDKIQNQQLCNYVFDMAINMGISPAVKCLQRACWAAWGDKSILVEDGILGPKTLHLINNSWSHWQDILSAMRSERAGTYKLIVCKKPDQQANINGWLNRAYGVSQSSHNVEEGLKAS